MALTTGLQAYYKLDESSGTWSDSVGNWDGTNNSADYGTAGIINDSATFASGDYIDVGDADFGVDTGDLSISCWIKSTANGDQWIVAEDNNSGRSFAFGTIGVLQCQIAGAASAANGVTDATTGSWVHVGMTFDTSTNAMIYYHSGSADKTTTMTGNLINTAQNCVIGKRTHSVSNPFVGSIDELGIWNVVLTADDMSALYNSGDGLAYPLVPATGTLFQVQVDDAWKEVAAIQVQVDDAWKEVKAAHVQIDDSWKEVF